jgi:hypothetical protein
MIPLPCVHCVYCVDELDDVAAELSSDETDPEDIVPYKSSKCATTTAGTTTKGRTTAKASRGRGGYDSDESYTDGNSVHNEVRQALLRVLLPSILLAKHVVSTVIRNSVTAATTTARTSADCWCIRVCAFHKNRAVMTVHRCFTAYVLCWKRHAVHISLLLHNTTVLF